MVLAGSEKSRIEVYFNSLVLLRKNHTISLTKQSDGFNIRTSERHEPLGSGVAEDVGV